VTAVQILQSINPSAIMLLECSLDQTRRDRQTDRQTAVPVTCRSAADRRRWTLLQCTLHSSNDHVIFVVDWNSC